MSYEISLIHPSRQRPEQALETAKKWLQCAAHKMQIEYILSIDATDALLNEYLNKFSGLPIKILANDNHSAIEAINHGAKNANGNIFIVVSDDFDCPEDWDIKLVEAIGGRVDFIAKTDDGCQPWIITLPIMDRAYYNRFGYIYYPEYIHMFCDTEMTHVADLVGRKITLSIKFLHKHYSQKGGQPYDEINKKNDNTWMQGESLYLKRVNENFGLAGFAGKLNCAAHHTGWLQSKGVWQTA